MSGNYNHKPIHFFPPNVFKLLVSNIGQAISFLSKWPVLQKKIRSELDLVPVVSRLNSSISVHKVIWRQAQSWQNDELWGVWHQVMLFKPLSLPVLCPVYCFGKSYYKKHIFTFWYDPRLKCDLCFRHHSKLSESNWPWETDGPFI